MDLTDQTLSGKNEICLNDSLNASLMKLKVKMMTDTVAPSSDDVIIYVDKSTSTKPTEERKQYILNLSSPLKFCEQVGDELVEQIKIKDNSVIFEAFVNHFVGTNESGNYALDIAIREEIDSVPITLFAGVNYIYTNYTNADITVIYPKNNEFNKTFLNNAIYSEYVKNDISDFSLDDLYFKDAFTKTENKLNLEVNNVNVDCLTSRNNKFSLDEEGNLIVNSITTNTSSETPAIDNTAICNLIYPVGSLYMSVNSTNPATLFGGTWSQINGYYLYAGIGGKTAGSNTSGAPSTNTTGSTKLTVSQIPSHTHNTAINYVEGNAGVNKYPWLASYDANTSKFWMNQTSSATGSGQGHTHTLSSHHHNVTPLRYEVYMWKRTA